MIMTHLIKAPEHRPSTDCACDEIERDFEPIMKQGLVFQPKWADGDDKLFDAIRLRVTKFRWGGDVSFLDYIARAHGFNAKYFEHRLCYGSPKALQQLCDDHEETEEKTSMFISHSLTVCGSCGECSVGCCALW